MATDHLLPRMRSKQRQHSGAHITGAKQVKGGILTTRACDICSGEKQLHAVQLRAQPWPLRFGKRGGNLVSTRSTVSLEVQNLYVHRLK